MAQRKGGSQAGCLFRFYYTMGLDTTEKQVPGPGAHKHERPPAQPLPAPASPWVEKDGPLPSVPEGAPLPLLNQCPLPSWPGHSAPSSADGEDGVGVGSSKLKGQVTTLSFRYG